MLGDQQPRRCLGSVVRESLAASKSCLSVGHGCPSSSHSPLACCLLLSLEPALALLWALMGTAVSEEAQYRQALKALAGDSLLSEVADSGALGPSAH